MALREKNTKALAESLNLVTDIYSASELLALDGNKDAAKKIANNLDKKTSKEFMIFYQFLIIIDFEATCWENKRNRTQEIIEFPAVLYDTKTGEVLDQFQEYCQPQEDPNLTSFCTELTGITQQQVNAGILLKHALHRFDKWLDEVSRKHKFVFHESENSRRDRLCTLVTWSDWDLGRALPEECKRKKIDIDFRLTRWIDLKALFISHYKRRPKGLADAMSFVGLAFEGRQHCGLTDAQNTGRLALRMLNDRCPIDSSHLQQLTVVQQPSMRTRYRALLRR